MYILAIHQRNHDTSAALFADGNLVAAAEEERFVRIKHARNQFPSESIKFVLKQAEIGFGDVDLIARGTIPKSKFKNTRYFIKKAIDSPTIAQTLNNLNDTLVDFAGALVSPNYYIYDGLRHDFDPPFPPIRNFDHHYSHAMSAFAMSGLDEAICVTADGIGDFDSTSVWVGEGGDLDRVQTYKSPNSIGWFYGATTEFLGFRRHNGEGKVMGLAAHGEYDEDIVDLLQSQVNVGPDYDVTAITRNGISGGVKQLESLFETNKLPRDSRPDFTEFHKNLAFATQHLTEKIICNIVQKYTSEYDVGNVCFAGGVALNCKVNQAISKLDSVDRLFTQPVANDAGIAIGAGLAAHESMPKNELSNLYLGPGYTTEEIEHLLRKAKLDFKQHENVIPPAAMHLQDGKIVAWFQGRMELGPRALGNRSILANPSLPDMKDKINESVKNRENWRPFAPSVMIDYAHDYFEGDMDNSSFMIQTHDVVQDKISEIPAVIHEGDHTARPQVVREDQNPKYYNLIKQFHSMTDVPVLLNTSLNDNGEPIIDHPKDALKFYFANGIDVLVIDNFILEK